jgi:hypothetical protein
VAQRIVCGKLCKDIADDRWDDRSYDIGQIHILDISLIHYAAYSRIEQGISYLLFVFLRALRFFAVR